MKASRLVLDYELYPRERIEPYNIGQMVEALKAGAKLPPIIVERNSLRVVDGFHRVRAYQKAYGNDCDIPVKYQEYANDAEMFADSVRLNANHGRQLSNYDRAHCIAKAEALNLEPAVISSLLNMTLETLSEMKTERFATYKMQPQVLKRTAAHLAGKNLTDEEAEYNIKAGGMHQTFYINQVIAMLEADTADWANPKVTNGLKKLHRLIDEAIKVLV